MKTATLPTPGTVKRRKADKLPPRLERFTVALTRGLIAASKAPTGTVNLADYLDAAQIRMLVRLAEKGGQTPRQYLDSLIERMTRFAMEKTPNRATA
ncbi:MAG: hypothetical protein V4819_01510 [Verrucomicrobiota bacterium]